MWVAKDSVVVLVARMWSFVWRDAHMRTRTSVQAIATLATLAKHDTTRMHAA